MKKITSKEYFLGVDISKDVLDLSLIHGTSYGSFKDKKIKNSFDGFEKML